MLIDAKLLYFPSFVNINFSFVSACSSLCYSGLTGRKANKNGRAGAAGRHSPSKLHLRKPLFEISIGFCQKFEFFFRSFVPGIAVGMVLFCQTAVVPFQSGRT